MATFSKPATVPRWNDDLTNNVEPAEAKKDVGWTFQELHPSTFENWRTNLNGAWWKWIDERWSDGGSADEIVLNDPATAAPITTYLKSGDEHIHRFDTGDEIFFDDVLNEYGFRIGATQQIRIGAAGLEVADGLNVGFLATPADDTIACADANFRMDFSDAEPFIRFDAGEDDLLYERSSNEFHFLIAGATETRITTTGMEIDKGLSVGFLTAAADDTIACGDSNFRMDFDGTDPFVVFDTGNDDIFFDRSANEMNFRLAGTVEMAIRGGGLQLFRGLNVGFVADPTNDTIAIGDANFTVDFAAGSPIILFDTNDRLNYNRGTNKFSFIINGGLEVGIDTVGVGISNGLRVGDAGGSGINDQDIMVDGGINCGGTSNPTIGQGIFTNGINVGFDASPATDEVRVGDVNFGLRFFSATQPHLQFDSGADGIIYSRTTNSMNFLAGGTTMVMTGASTTEKALHFASMTNGTATPTSLTAFAQIFSRDDGGGVGQMFAADENGTATQLTSHDVEGNWIHRSVNGNTKIETTIRIEELVRELEKKLGKSFTTKREINF